MNKLFDVKIKIYAIDVLHEVKKHLTYHELSKELHLSAPVISRYVKGHVLPNIDRAQSIIEWYEKTYFKKTLQQDIYVGIDGVIDASFLTYDTILQKMIAKHALNYFKDVIVSKVLTVETNGIPIAVQIGSEFGVDVIIARKERQAGIDKYYEERYLSIPPIVRSLYVPRSCLKKNDQVLIVDDLVRSGNTVRALVNIVRRSGASITGVFSVIEVGKIMAKLKNEMRIDAPMFTILSK
ncbi:MAG: phosphoribosyltransferase family protein [Nitrososphaeria archaeon]